MKVVNPREKERLRRKIHGLHEKACQAIKVAARKALQAHKKVGVPAAIWKNGKVVWLYGKCSKRVRKVRNRRHHT